MLQEFCFISSILILPIAFFGYLKYFVDPFFLPLRYTMASASADNIKQWKFPDGNFIQNLTGHNAILNCLAINSDNVLVSGGMYFLSW